MNILAIVILGIVAYLGTVFAGRYLAASGTVTERLWAACQQSATIVVAKLTAAAGAFVAFLPQIGDALGDPDLKAQFMSVVTPQYAGAAAVAVALLVFYARKRTL